MSQVQVGQIWCDKDKRRLGRLFEVVDVGLNLADCVLVSNGKRMKTKIRLDRFQTKYYVLRGTAFGLQVKAGLQVKVASASPSASVTTSPSPPAPVSTSLSDECAKILGGAWGGFGNYALFDNSKVHIIVRFVRANCYDVKIRLDGHLVYSSVSRADLNTTLGQVRSSLKSLRDNITDIVGNK